MGFAAVLDQSRPLSTGEQGLMIAVFLGLNLSLNMLQKYVLGTYGFRFAVALTISHLVSQIRAENIYAQVLQNLASMMASIARHTCCLVLLIEFNGRKDAMMWVAKDLAVTFAASPSQRIVMMQAFGFVAVLPAMMLPHFRELHRTSLSRQWKGIVAVGSFIALNIVLNNLSLVILQNCFFSSKPSQIAQQCASYHIAALCDRQARF